MCIKLLFPLGGGGYNSFCASHRDRTPKKRSRKRPYTDDDDNDYGYGYDYDYVLTLFEFIPKLRGEGRTAGGRQPRLVFSFWRVCDEKSKEGSEVTANIRK